MELTGWDLLKALIGGAIIGAGIGHYFGGRAALRRLVKEWPEARNDMLLLGMRDPLRAWWKMEPRNARRWKLVLGIYGVFFLITIPLLLIWD